MSVAFSTAGRVAFRVTIEPKKVALARFSEAVFRADARVSLVTRTNPREWHAVVWLKAVRIPTFENVCLPDAFEFMSTREVIRGVRTEDVIDE